MLSAAVQQKIRQLHLVTKRLMDGPLLGDDATVRHGYGIEFHQIRDYQTGDDVRFIDWRGSARLGKLLIKECLQERNRTVIVAVDVSASALFGSHTVRIEKLREIAAVLLFAAHYARDSVGLVLFADTIVLSLFPKNSASYVHVLINQLYTFAPVQTSATNLSCLFTHIAQQWRKDALVFVISDFIDENFSSSLRAAAVRADIVVVRCVDPVERHLPEVGLLCLRDMESGQQVLVDMESKEVRAALACRLVEQDNIFAHARVDVLDVGYESDVCAILIDFFKRRMVHTHVRSW